MDLDEQELEMVEALVSGVRAGKRRPLAKAISLVENSLPRKQAMASVLINRVLPFSGGAIRVGVSGVPGVGKSTFIEALGLFLVEQGLKVAVLAVDPSSKISGGSILGDKVRMELLSRHPSAFIRPSPTAGSLGGVARRTRESMLVCEAAGYDVILIETVGVGQSEVAVCEMVDFFLVLMLPNAGDEIQGIKKGILEMADALVVNKADGDMVTAAESAVRRYQSALHFVRPKTPGYQVPVLRASAARSEGIESVWQAVLDHRGYLEQNHGLKALRSDQYRLWFQTSLRETLLEKLYSDQELAQFIGEKEREIAARRCGPRQAAEQVVARFLERHVR